MKSIKEYLNSKREFTTQIPFTEDITIPVNVGDIVLGGKFKNKKVVVKKIGKNDKGDITINDKSILRIRILDKQPKEDKK